MIQIRSISDGDKHFESGVFEYSKRLGRDIQIINIKPSKKDTVQQIVAGDTETIIDKIRLTRKSKDAYFVLLSKEGKSWTTEQWKFMLESKKNSSIDIIFLIGGPYGFDELLLGPVLDIKLSFGAVTMPHWLVKLVALEQIYRCLQIMSWKQYHY